MTDQAKDGRKPLSAWIDMRLVKSGMLDAYEMAVYVQLVGFASFDDHTCYPSTKTLAEMANISRRKVVSCIQSLEEKRLISVKRTGESSSTYTVLDYDPVHEVHTPHAHDADPRMHEVHTNNNHIEQDTKEQDLSAVADAPQDEQVTALEDKPAFDWNEWLNTVSAEFRVTTSRARNILHVLRGTVAKGRKDSEYYKHQLEEPMTDAQDIRAFGAWYRRTYPGIDMPLSPEAIATHVYRWRQDTHMRFTTPSDAASVDLSHFPTNPNATPDDAPRVDVHGDY